MHFPIRFLTSESHRGLKAAGAGAATEEVDSDRAWRSVHGEAGSIELGVGYERAERVAIERNMSVENRGIAKLCKEVLCAYTLGTVLTAG